MPATTRCSSCGFEGNHGFTPVCAGVPLHFYHDGDCNGFWTDMDGNQHQTVLEAFLTVADRVANSKVWKEAMIAQFSGHPRTAKRLFKKWREEDD